MICRSGYLYGLLSADTSPAYLYKILCVGMYPVWPTQDPAFNTSITFIQDPIAEINTGFFSSFICYFIFRPDFIAKLHNLYIYITRNNVVAIGRYLSKNKRIWSVEIELNAPIC